MTMSFRDFTSMLNTDADEVEPSPIYYDTVEIKIPAYRQSDEFRYREGVQKLAAVVARTANYDNNLLKEHGYWCAGDRLYKLDNGLGPCFSHCRNNLAENAPHTLFDHLVTDVRNGLLDKLTAAMEVKNADCRAKNDLLMHVLAKIAKLDE